MTRHQQALRRRSLETAVSLWAQEEAAPEPHQSPVIQVLTPALAQEADPQTDHSAIQVHAMA